MTIKFLNIESASECQFVEDLYITAFPPEERRPLYKLYSLYNREDSPYNIEVIEEENKIVGFITYWDFEDYIYVEHFSISDKYRNGGFGKRSLLEFMAKMNHRPLVLEVELDTDEMAKRRIGFYQRLGFTLWDQLPYIQPPYLEGGMSLPMYLMSANGLDVAAHFEEIKDTLYRKVYGVRE